MIIVRRSSLNVNKLQNILSLSTSISPMTSPLLPSSSTSCNNSTSGVFGTVGGGGGSQIQSFDVFSPENKSKTIQLLTLDRENSNFIFNNFKNTKPAAEVKKNEAMDLLSVDDDFNRLAAVLIPLCYDVDGKPALLYNLRSQLLNKHRGEISFPGGSLDDEDKEDAVHAALRETHEELGITPESIEIWTTLRMFPTVSSNMGVIPVLGFIKGVNNLDPSTLQINPNEVDHAFTISLEFLCDNRNWEQGPIRKFKGQPYQMPIWKNLNVYNGSDEIALWGLTAFVTHVALLGLLPSHVYQRKLSYLQLQIRKLNDKPKL